MLALDTAVLPDQLQLPPSPGRLAVIPVSLHPQLSIRSLWVDGSAWWGPGHMPTFLLQEILEEQMEHSSYPEDEGRGIP